VIKIKDSIKNKQILKSEKMKFEEGIFSEKDYISPSYINLSNPKYIEIDEMFYSCLIAVNYYREQEDLILRSLIDTNINMNISIFYEKQDTYKTIRDLTYHIGNVGVELKESKQNKQDIDIASFSYNDARYIRKEMQVNGEEIYYMYIYLTVFSKDKKELEYLLNKVEGITQSKGIQTRRAYFREEQGFLSSLPFMQNHNEIKNVAKRNILTSGIVSTYPFISSSIFDEERNIYWNK
jgi:conjugal transfer ATP-binding protein TraC